MRKLVEKIRRVGLIANSAKLPSRALVRQAAGLIRRTRRAVFTDPDTAQLAGLPLSTYPDLRALARAVDLLIVIGGDGTMLRVAREVAGCRTPVIGINVGALGFLTDVQAHQLPLALRQIWAGQTILEARSLIEATTSLQKGTPPQTALNDFVISRGSTPRLIDLDVTVDQLPLTRYRCDGLIVCTPTGSTAYSLAAGGAVVSPTAEVLTLTPICPHTLSNRSVIVRLDSIVQVKIRSERVETFLTADGQKGYPLTGGEVVTIRRSRHGMRFLHLAGSSFFQTLRHKLSWSGSNV